MTIEVPLLEAATNTQEPTDRRPNGPVTPTRSPRPSRRAGLGEWLGGVVRRPGLVLSVVWLVIVVLAALIPTLLTSVDPLRAVPRQKLLEPSWAHLFGTDQLGRDLFARVVHGAALSLGSALLAVLVGIVVGSLLGLVAGFVRGVFDEVLMRIVDVLLAIPALLLSLALVTALGFGTVKVAIAVGITSVAACARVMRSEVLRVRESAYIEAARAGGARWSRILFRHVLPNAAGPVLVLATLEFGTAILAVSALSFLGYGAVPPAPEWGSLVAQGRDFLSTAWWLTTMPGLTIAITVLAAGRLSRALGGQDGVRR
ncbi:ABC transporter permease [Nakamurella leprariae]|uniref:ABC transporter permease n=1 Tax=Nakamurella leprariae TaxID=2803911 RepID=A0A939BXC4_9ACTN|nr:ABC transporter permease [Nakamurella leprariae]MBM9465835.1 ABC transporter permease [Nakamurella leprariae]